MIAINVPNTESEINAILTCNRLCDWFVLKEFHTCFNNKNCNSRHNNASPENNRILTWKGTKSFSIISYTTEVSINMMAINANTIHKNFLRLSDISSSECKPDYLDKRLNIILLYWDVSQIHQNWTNLPVYRWPLS